MKGLAVGKAIFSMLEGIKNVYPLVVDKNVKFPFVVYRRTGMQAANSKDRFCYSETATVEVIVASDNYNESIDVASIVLYRLEHTRGEFNDIIISEIELLDADEDFIEDTYIQKLTFKIEIK